MKKNVFKNISVLLILGFMVSSCHVGRFFYWNFADVNDYKKFPSLPLTKADHPFYFFTADQTIDYLTPTEFIENNKNQKLTEFLEDHKTLSFLIIRNDSILFEEYFGGYDDTSVVPSFSVSKVFVSALTGIAIDEGFIRSTAEPITKFIPELLENDSAFAKITIEDLLNMRSGIDFGEGYSSPFADMAKYYYGTNLEKYLHKLKIAEPPDENYDYISVNTLLMGIILERSTGKKLNTYLSQKIWEPLGMEFDASWSIDSKKHQQIKSFCCINARARDYAKLGRLYLNDGNWEGEQIVPKAWVEKSMSVINDSRDSQDYSYTYFWRVKEDGAIFAKGVLGQYIYVDPAKKVVIVRLGKKSSDVVWPDFFEKICGNL